MNGKQILNNSTINNTNPTLLSELAVQGDSLNTTSKNWFTVGHVTNTPTAFL